MSQQASLKDLLLCKQKLSGDIEALEQSIRPQIVPLKAELSEVEKRIEVIVLEPAKASFSIAGKDTGTVHFDLDQVHVEVTREKSVKWDQGKLTEIFQKIRSAGDNPNQYIKTEYKVSENLFKEWPDAVRAVFTTARTVTPGKPKFEFTINPEDIPS